MLWRWNDVFNRKDVTAIRAIFHPDLRIKTAYPVGYMASEISVEAFLTMVTSIAQRFEYFTETLTSIFVTADPEILVTEYEAEARRLNDGYIYRNKYVSIIRFQDSRITEFSIYADNLAMRALLEGPTDAA